MKDIAKVVVDLSLDREFDYLIPPSLQEQVHVGSRVIVPFGHSETRGYVIALADRSSIPGIKAIREVVGKKPLLSDGVLQLAKWMADYYCAPVENAVRTVLPGAVRAKDSGFVERLMVVPTDAAQDLQAVERLRAKAPRQAAVLDTLMTGGEMFLSRLAKQAGVTAGTVHGLEKKGYVRIARQVAERDPMAEATWLPTQPLPLMPQQQEALNIVQAAMEGRGPSTVLLYGVTGSGKTEVYLQAIQQALDKGQGAIVLVPEIALTPQTVERFRARFGDCVAILHSHLSTGERHDEWHRLHEGRARIAVGARSALFAPVHALGLIVVDEEHEPTYKQDEAPRYNARDVAVMRGRLESCAVLLGTATPSLESYHNALEGKYALARLPIRVDGCQMPEVRVVDMRQEAEREGRAHVLSRDLVEAIRDRLDKAEQTMLFLNRRGFSSSMICPKCGFVARCEHCSVAMTYHKKQDRLFCHVCGAVRRVPSRCPNPECADPSFRGAGLGTEKVEEVLAKVFPKARVRRMDSDTMTRKESYREVLGAFRTGHIDILVGTQMIAKGLHFPNVTLVGVIHADMTLHMPDFRAGERTFQLLTQVAGRAGRGEVLGEVIVQTYTPFHPAVQAARRMDFEGFADQEMEFRRELEYPPFFRLVCLTFKGVNEEQTMHAAAALAGALRPRLSPRVILSDPAPAPLAKAKSFFRYQLILRAPTVKAMTVPLRAVLKAARLPKGVTCSIDVDALSLM